MGILGLQVILMVAAGITAVLSSAELQDSQNFILPEDGSFSDFTSTEWRVRHLEADHFIVGNILFVDGESLKTSDGNKTETIIGKARESGYVEGIGTNVRIHSRGFHQIYADQVVLADYGNHCLRLLHRVTQQTSPYAGNCTHSGYTDGTYALFHYPVHIITDKFHQEKTLIITDRNNLALREINTKTRVVRTLIQSSEMLPAVWGITQDSVTGDLFVTIRHGIVRFIYETKTLIHMAGSHTHGDRYGAFSDALFNYPRGIVLHANNKMLVADEYNHVLRLLDLTTETTSTICTSYRRKTNGSINVCEPTNPISLLVVGDMLYCGEQGGIRMVRGRSTMQTEQPRNNEELSERTTMQTEQPVNIEKPSVKEYPTDTIIWISVSVGSVLLIFGIIVLVVWAYKRRNLEQSQGDVYLTPIRQRDCPADEADHYYSTVDDSIRCEASVRSNRSLPERNDNSHQDKIDIAEDVNPESIPYFLSPGGAPHYLPMS